MSRPNLWSYPVLFVARGPWERRAPGLPCALSVERVKQMAELGRRCAAGIFRHVQTSSSAKADDPVRRGFSIRRRRRWNTGSPAFAGEGSRGSSGWGMQGAWQIVAGGEQRDARGQCTGGRACHGVHAGYAPDRPVRPDEDSRRGGGQGARACSTRRYWAGIRPRRAVLAISRRLTAAVRHDL
jgi:hypothetical protein